MATYAKVLLSGATYGSHEDIAIDTTYTTIHQTSTTSGAIEDVTIVVYNPTSTAVGITISIEQDGTVIKSFADGIPANDSKTVISQVTFGENVDVKIKQSVSGDPVLDNSTLIIGNNNNIYTADLDGSNLSTFQSSLGPSTCFGVDPVNGYLFKASATYDIRVYSLDDESLVTTLNMTTLGLSTYIPNSQFTVVPLAKKLVVTYMGQYTAVIDYSSGIESATLQRARYNGNTDMHYCSANLYGVIGVNSSNTSVVFMLPWDDLEGSAYPTPSVSGAYNICNSANGKTSGDVNGSGWSIFQGNGSYSAAHGTWDGGASAVTTTSVPEYYAAECVFDGNGNIIYIPSISNSTYRIRKYALTSNTHSAQAGSYSDDYTKTANQYRGPMPPINDGTNDVFIFHNKNSTASKVVLSDCSVSTLSNDPYSGTEADDLGTFVGKAPQTPMYFTGYANQQLP